MHITSQTPRPEQPRNKRGSRWSWLFFLVILARPLWGVIRSLLGPQVTDIQAALIVGGVVLVGVVVILITLGASRASSRDQTLPVPGQPLRDYRAPAGGNVTWTAPRSASYKGQPPRFEPMITGKVVLAGMILAVAIAAGLSVIWFAP